MTVPTNSIFLMRNLYKEVFPVVHTYLGQWKMKATYIPDEELRRQALASIATKDFHCEGGAAYALLAKSAWQDCIRFIVAYQTISDYLDNLCDRSTSLDPKDFRALHQAMLDALTPGTTPRHYYRYRQEQEDGGYLKALVQTCQEVLTKVKHYEKIAPILHELASYYCDLQVYKHIEHEERVPTLEAWFNRHKDKLPALTWYEFSASAGSTLGIFCLVAYAFNEQLPDRHINQIKLGLFPYVQGLHILLDYFIDQTEDQREGDLNFCCYFPNEEVLTVRLCHFLEQADRHIQGLPDEHFHRLINRGLLGVYLSDKKVKEQPEVFDIAKKILRLGGFTSKFFYINGRWYRRITEKRKYLYS